MSYLVIRDCYGAAKNEVEGDDVDVPIVVVDSPKSLRSFVTDLSQLQVLTTDGNGSKTDSVALVGLDTEWRPKFMFDNPNEPQVVLLMQSLPLSTQANTCA